MNTRVPNIQQGAANQSSAHQHTDSGSQAERIQWPAAGTGGDYQQMADNSEQVRQLHTVQRMMNESTDTPVVQRVNWTHVDKAKITFTGDHSDDYTAFWEGVKAGELELFTDDDGRKWINFVETEEAFQKRGIGMALLNKAVQDHGKIYAAVGMTNHEETGDDDTRHLSMEGAALVSSAVRNGILQDEWCFNPAEEQQDDYDGGYDDDPGGGGSDDDNGGYFDDDDGGGGGSDDDGGGSYSDDQGGGGEAYDEGGDEGDEEEAPAEITCSAVVTLDDSNTGGIGYEYWVDLTDTTSGATITLEFNGTVAGEEELTRDVLEARLTARAIGAVHLTTIEFEYID